MSVGAPPPTALLFPFWVHSSAEEAGPPITSLSLSYVTSSQSERLFSAIPGLLPRGLT